MTEALYRDDAYLRGCVATVQAVDSGRFSLDQTVFYPLGGGQPGDSGRLRTADGRDGVVTDTRRDEGGEIFHVVEGADIQPGDTITLRLDWERRYAHMRMHTCLHLLGSLLKFPVTGGNISAVKGRLDFDMSDLVDKQALTAQLNALIVEDHPVATRWITDEELDSQPDLIRTMSVEPPRGQGRVRLLDIAGVDLQPCGGTHVKSTAEIGAVRIAKVEKKGRQNRRFNVVFADSQ